MDIIKNKKLPDVVEEYYSHNENKPLLILLLCMVYGVTMGLRGLMGSYIHYLPQKTILALNTIFIAMICSSVKYLNFITLHEINFPPRFLYMLFYPFYITSVCYKCDGYQIFKYFWHVLLIMSVLLLVSLPVHAFTMNALADSQWKLYQMLAYATVFLPNVPQYVIGLLFEEKYRHVKFLMQGESIVMILISVTIMDILLGCYDGMITKFSHVVLVLSRLIFGGILIGYCSGIITTSLFRISHNDAKSSLCYIVSGYLLCYYLCNYLGFSAEMSVLIYVLVICSYRRNFPESIKQELMNYFDTLHYLLDNGVFIYLTFLTVQINANSSKVFDASKFKVMVYNYSSMIMSRIFAYMVLYPILKKLRDGMNFKSIFILSWGILTSNPSATMSLILYHNRSSSSMGLYVMSQIPICILATQFLNSTTFMFFMRTNFLHEYTYLQLSNMHSCLKYVNSNASKCINMWKMKKIMSDARWDLVRENTIMRHPYFKDNREHSPSEHFFNFTPKKALCPVCSRMVMGQTTKKGASNMKKEVRQRVFSEIKIAIMKEKNMGKIPPNYATKLIACLGLHDADRTDFKVDMFEIYSYFKLNKMVSVMVKYAMKWFSVESLPTRKPRNTYRAICYKIICHRLYNRVEYFFVMFYLLPLISNLPAFASHPYWITVNLTLNAIYSVVMTTDVIINILAYSFVKVKAGARIYYKSPWNILATTEICILYVDIVVNGLMMLLHMSIITEFKYIRVIRLLRMTRTQVPKCLHFLEEIVEARNAIGYEMAQTLKECYDDVMLHVDKFGTEYPEIYEECYAAMETDRMEIFDIMIMAQKSKPWMTSAVKTNKILNSSIKSMQMTLNDLKMSGFVDDYEYSKVAEVIFITEKKYRGMKKVPITTFEGVFSNVPWYIRTEPFPDMMLKGAVISSCEEGTVLVELGQPTDGIFVVVKGLLKLTYTANNEMIYTMHDKGQLPIIDYAESMKFDRNIAEMIVPGNSIGELSYLSDRFSDCQITAVVDSELFFLPTRLLDTASALFTDPIDGLQARMWKRSTINVGYAVLSSVKAYQLCTKLELKTKLDKAIAPDLDKYLKLLVTDAIEDLVLVNGLVEDENDKKKYIAPCHIPRGVFLLNLTVTRFPVKFLVLPAKNSTITQLKEHDGGCVELTLQSKEDAAASEKNLPKTWIDNTSIDPHMRRVREVGSVSTPRN